MASSQAQVACPASGGQPVSFRFPVTWTYLAGPLVSAKVVPVKPEPAQRPVPEVVPSAPQVLLPRKVASEASVAPPRPPVQEIVATPRPTDTWEMIIPKMGRPAPRPARVPPAVASIPKAPREPEPVTIDALPAFATREPENSSSAGLKLSLAGIAVLMIGGIIYFSNAKGQQAPLVAQTFEVGPALPVGMSGWISDFAPLSGWSQYPRVVSVLRGSQNLTDFRIEFPAQIDRKALGWVFRAKDPKNFYVMKLEIVKPLPAAEGVVTHFAVINGQEQSRVQLPLSVPLRPNTVYTIRMEALGSSFTTWLQGQKIDQWADPQISEGGIGTYSELGERGVLKGEMAVFTLVAKSPLTR
jgi:hypothetical protein